MKRHDIASIISTLKYCENDFDSVHSEFICEYAGVKYEIVFDRSKDDIINFSLTAIGDTQAHENT